MPKKGLINLAWPSGGLNRRAGLQSQPPFTSPDCLNIRSFDPIQQRERGGSRPGLTKAYYDQLGSGNPVRLLTQVSVVEDDGYKPWEDDFQSNALGSAWSAASWIGTAPGVVDDFADISYGTAVGAVASALANFDTGSAYEIGLYITPYNGQHNGKYQIFGRMGSGLAATTDGFVAELVMADAIGTYSGTLKTYNAGTATTYTFSGGATGKPESGWFRVLVNGSTISCTWLTNSLTSQTPTFGGSAGHRFGFGMEATVAGGVCLVDNFRISYKTNNNNQMIRSPLIASSNGSLYYESRPGKLTAVTTDLTLASDRQLMSAERAQRLYIADHGPYVASGTDGVNGTGNNKFDASGVSDWTTLGIDTDDHVLVLTSATGLITAGVYAISSVASGELTTATDCNTGSGACSWRIERCPKVYNPNANTLSKLMADSGAGSVPVGCPLICRFRDRVVMAGGSDAPHVWYMSRQGTPTDWDYADTDSQRAVAGTSSDAGTIGDPITALISHSDDYLIFGCTNSMWILRGDPAFGGQIGNVSRNVGVVDKLAWCYGPAGELIWLSRDGLYMLPPGGQGIPASISRDVLPRELLDIDANMYTVTLRYAYRDRGVHIFISAREAKSTTHWFFDWRTKAFLPDTYPNSYEPTTAHEFFSTSAQDGGVLLGCRDGYIRRFYVGQETDDGTTFSSYAFIGPIRLGGDGYHDGRLDEIVGTLAEDSGDVDWVVRVGETAEAAISNDAFTSGTWTTDGINYKARPRSRGAWFTLELNNGGVQRWAIEGVQGILTTLGKQRL